MGKGSRIEPIFVSGFNCERSLFGWIFCTTDIDTDGCCNIPSVACYEPISPIIYYNHKHEQLRALVAHSHRQREDIAYALRRKNANFSCDVFFPISPLVHTSCVHAIFIFVVLLSVTVCFFLKLQFSQLVEFVDFSKVHSVFIQFFMCEMQTFCLKCWLVNKYGFCDVTDI